MKLQELAKQIVNQVPEYGLTVQEIYASLDFRGCRNQRLAIPAWHVDDFRDPEKQRHEFLSGEEEVEGEFLVFHYCRHDGTMFLTECDSLAEAAQLVLGGAGVFNVFTDLELVFDHFRLRPYRVSYRSGSGARVIFARDQLANERVFADRQIEWLGVAA
jgi:hypothetical protein